jgi:hypothetical protein
MGEFLFLNVVKKGRSSRPWSASRTDSSCGEVDAEVRRRNRLISNMVRGAADPPFAIP